MAKGVQKSNFKFYLLILIILLSLLASLFFHFYVKDLNQLILSISDSKFFAFFYISLYIISSFISIPFLTFLGARIFPFNQAIIYSIIGNMLSAIIMFYLVRWLGRDFVRKYEKKHKAIQQLRKSFKKYPFRNIFLLRLFYVLPPEIANVLGGISEMSFEKYFFASLLGVIPMTIFSVLLIKSYLWQDYTSFLISLIAFAMMLLIPLFYFSQLRKIFWKKKK